MPIFTILQNLFLFLRNLSKSGVFEGIYIHLFADFQVSKVQLQKFIENSRKIRKMENLGLN
jgi:hypothetical protein